MKAKSAKKRSRALPTPRLQKWHKNDIFEAIQAFGLHPRDFDLEDSDAVSRIKHKWSESCFNIGGGPGRYSVSYVVGDGSAWSIDVYSWETLISRVSGWLKSVKHDLDTPDLWAELQREVDLLGAGSDEVTENTPFTPDEQKEIARRLRELAQYASNKYSLSGVQIQALDAKLDYLVKASGRVGRVDWRSIFIGTIFSFILSAALPSESAHDILLTLLRGIVSLYPELPSG